MDNKIQDWRKSKYTGSVKKIRLEKIGVKSLTFNWAIGTSRLFQLFRWFREKFYPACPFMPQAAGIRALENSYEAADDKLNGLRCDCVKA